MRILIYGSKSFASTVAELVTDCGHDVVGMVDDFNAGEGILGTFEDVLRTYPPQDFGISIAIGYTNIPARWAVWERVRSAGYHSPALIHPAAYVAKSARVGNGAMVMAGAIIDVRADIGELAVVWPGACINHDALVGANCFISPSVTLCGFARIGAHSFIGAGSVVVDHGNVPEGGFIKMFTRYVG